MESPDETSLRESFSSIFFKVVNCSVRTFLSHNLDVKSPLPAKNGNRRDYRGLAELMGFTFNDIRRFERYDEPTMKILDSWEIQPDATIEKLIGFLEEMERHDIVQELIPLLERDIKTFYHRPKLVQNIPIQVDESIYSITTSLKVTSCKDNNYNRDIITCDDAMTGECTLYDAYVCYAEEDTKFVEELAHHLEPPSNKFKLCIHGRDMLPGGDDLESKIDLIKQRCRLMLIILSPNFLRSSACAFQTSFAASLAIEQRKRMLIPLIVSPCEIPSLLKYLSRLDFTNPHGRGWLWNKLVASLCRMRQEFERHPKEAIHVTESLTTNTEPTIEYPETKQHKLLPADNSVLAIEASGSATSVKIFEEESENDTPENENQNMKTRLISSLRNKFGSSNASSTSQSLFSGASSNTSGFHSQSDNIESSISSI